MLRFLFYQAIWIFAVAWGYPPEAVSLEAIDGHYEAGKTRTDFLKSESELLESLQQSPASVALSWRLARTYLALGKFAEGDAKKDYYKRCIRQCQRAIRINPRSAMAFFLKGVCRGKLGELEGIWSSLGIIKPFKKDMMTAIRLDPSVDHGGPHRALGRMYFELPALFGGSLGKSIQHLKEAVRLDPGYGENYFFLAETYYEDSQYSQARSTLLKLLEVTGESPGNPDVQEIRQKARVLLDKIQPWLKSQESHAQRTED
ncbi:MAG: tetratricopeptide repeat protein [Nitrospinaceae bacterium]